MLENTAGSLYKLASVLQRGDIDIRSLYATEGHKFSTIHLLVDKFDISMKLLKQHGYFVNSANVFVLKTDDKPGSFLKVLEMLRAIGLNIEYVYCFGKNSDNYVGFIFCITKIDDAIELFKKGMVSYRSTENIEGKK